MAASRTGTPHPWVDSNFSTVMDGAASATTVNNENSTTAVYLPEAMTSYIAPSAARNRQHAWCSTGGNTVIIGVPTEIKNQEYRVGMVPGTARSLVERGHTVLIQRGAGIGSGIPDTRYTEVGAKLVDGPDDVWGAAEMVV